MKTVETNVFTFDELTDRAKEKARAWYREGALDYEWYDSILLEDEYEYLNSDEVVDESIRANEYEFHEDGGIA